MSDSLTGGCACGRIRYKCSEKPLVHLLCHCRDCQRASGSAYAAVVIVPCDRVSFSGPEPKYHEVKAESGRTMRRGFCSECGSPLSIRRPETPHIEFLHASSLDDPSLFKPSCELWVSHAFPWHHFHPEATQFDEGPSEEAVRAPVMAYFASRS